MLASSPFVIASLISSVCDKNQPTCEKDPYRIDQIRSGAAVTAPSKVRVTPHYTWLCVSPARVHALRSQLHNDKQAATDLRPQHHAKISRQTPMLAFARTVSARKPKADALPALECSPLQNSLTPVDSLLTFQSTSS